MSAQVEDRIVNLKINNKQFEAGARQSLSTLDRIKAAMNFRGSGNGIDNLQRSADRFNLSGMSRGIDGVSLKFAALATAGITALSNITNRAVDAGINFVKSFTVQPALDGFNEYETKIKATQTILSNTARYGTKLPEVNKALNDLNHYADKTIYNFGEMTKNVGLFTNAGLRVGEATDIIKGFSNEAAASGTSAEGAASAAYQLSQALSAGTIRLMDFRSLQNVGMGNKNMQHGLIEIADAMGTLEEKGVSAEEVTKNFNGTLEKGWLSSEVMSNYLKIQAGSLSVAEQKTLGLTDAQIKQFAIQQKNSEDAATKVRTLTQLVGTIRESIGSGYSAIFEQLFGDFNSATELFTGINNSLGGAIAKYANAKIALTKAFVKGGGRDDFLQGVKNVLDAIMAILGPIHDAFRDIFPPATAKDLIGAADSFEKFTKSLIISKKTGEGLREVFGGAFAVIHILSQVIGGVIHYFASLIGLILGAGDSVTIFGGGLGSMLVKLDQFLSKGDKISSFFNFIIDARARVFEPLIAIIGGVIEAFAALITDGPGAFVDKIKGLEPLVDAFFGAIIDSVARVTGSFGSIGDVLDTIQSKLSSFGGPIGKGIAALAGAIGGLFSGLGGEGGKASGDLNQVRSSLDKVGDSANRVKSFLSAVGDAISATFDSIRLLFFAFGDKIGVVFTKLKDKFQEFISGFTATDAVALVNSGVFLAVFLQTKKFFKVLTDLLENGAGTIGNINKVLDSVTASFKSMQKVVRATVILEIAIAVGILALSLLVLSKIPYPKLVAGLASLAVLTYILGKAFENFSKVLDDKDLKDSLGIAIAATALAALGVAMLAFAGAVVIFSKIPLKDLAKGLTAFAVTLGVVTAAAHVLNDSGGGKQLIAAAFAIGIMSASLIIFAGAVKLFSKIDTKTLINGGLKIAATLVGLSLALKLLPPGILLSSASLVIVSGALYILAGAIELFGHMDTGTFFKGIIRIAGGLALLAVAMNLMTTSLPGAAALAVVVAALTLLIPALVILGNLPIKVIVVALLALAGVMVILGGTLALLAPFGPAVLIAAAAIAVLGGAVYLTGAGLVLFAKALIYMVGVGAAGFATLATGIVLLAGTIPLVAQQIGLGLLAIAKVIAKAGPALVNAMATVLISLAKAVIRSAPHMASAFIVLIHQGLRVIRATFPDFLRTGFQLVGKLLDGISRQISPLVAKAVTLAVRFMNALGKQAGRLADSGAKLLIHVINGMATAINKHQGELERAAGRLGSAIIRGIGNAIRHGAGALIGQITGMAGGLVGAAAKRLGINSPSKEFYKLGSGIIEGMVLALVRHGHEADSAAESMADSTISVARRAVDGIHETLSSDLDVTPTITPVLDLTRLSNEASKISGLLPDPTLSATGIQGASAVDTANQAAIASAANQPALDPTPVEFKQYNYSPEALSDREIYRNTKNLLAMKRKELTGSDL